MDTLFLKEVSKFRDYLNALIIKYEMDNGQKNKNCRIHIFNVSTARINLGNDFYIKIERAAVDKCFWMYSLYKKRRFKKDKCVNFTFDGNAEDVSFSVPMKRLFDEIGAPYSNSIINSPFFHI